MPQDPDFSSKNRNDFRDLHLLAPAELLALQARILAELRTRNILRTGNTPTGDLAEHLFCRAFGWLQEPNSAKSHDAVGTDGHRYQIKGRRVLDRKGSRQLSALRDLDGFQTLAAVLFDAGYGVQRAALIPVGIVRHLATVDRHTNSHRFLLRDAIWNLPGVIDATEDLRRAIGHPSA